MMDKLLIIGSFGGLTWLLYLLSMTATPGKGWLRAAERICAGAVLCWLCHTLLQPFGLETAQSPLAALSAGYLGLPGAALVTALSLWP